MKVHHGIESYRKIKNPVVTVGTFDGVHFGHQKIINRLKRIASECNGESVLLTFDDGNFTSLIVNLETS